SATTITMAFLIFSFPAWGKAGCFATPAKARLWKPRARVVCTGGKASAPPRYGLTTTATAYSIYSRVITYDGRRSTTFLAAWMEPTNRIARRRRMAVTLAGCFTTAVTEHLRM